MFFVIANPMVVSFSLPEGITCFAEKFVGFASRESLPTLNNCAHGFIWHRPENHMNVVGHDDPRVQSITSVVEKTQSLSNKIRDFGAFQPALAIAGIKEILELAKIISLDFFKRILSARFLELFPARSQCVKAMETFRAFCLKLKQEILRQRIRKAKSYEIARALSFDVGEKTARVNAGTKGIGRLWLDAGCAQFKVYPVKPWILFGGGEHGGTLRQREDRGNALISTRCGMISCFENVYGLPSATRRYGRLKICATYTNRTNFLQRFYTSHEVTRQYVKAM